jgi:hypothetical protein
MPRMGCDGSWLVCLEGGHSSVKVKIYKRQKSEARRAEHRIHINPSGRRVERWGWAVLSLAASEAAASRPDFDRAGQKGGIPH